MRVGASAYAVGIIRFEGAPDEVELFSRRFKEQALEFIIDVHHRGFSSSSVWSFRRAR